MKYFSMFSGIGGFELGIEKAWKVIQEQRQQHLEQGRNISSNRYINNETSYKCVGFSEIDRYAIQIYQRHFPSHRNFGDATKINPKDLPDFDMLC